MRSGRWPRGWSRRRRDGIFWIGRSASWGDGGGCGWMEVVGLCEEVRLSEVRRGEIEFEFGKVM